MNCRQARTALGAVVKPQTHAPSIPITACSCSAFESERGHARRCLKTFRGVHWVTKMLSAGRFASRS